MSDVKLHRWPVINPESVYVLASDYDRLELECGRLRISHRSALEDCKARWTERDAALQELAALKAQPSAQEWPKQQCPVTGAITDVDPADMGVHQHPSAGVVLPERMTCDDGYPSDDWLIASAHNRCLDEVARLNPCSVQAVPDDIHDQHRKAMKLLREVRSWIIPKGNISMSIIERVGAFLDSAAPSAQQKESSDE